MSVLWRWIEEKMVADPFCFAMHQAKEHNPEGADSILLAGLMALMDDRQRLIEEVVACRTKHVDPIPVGDKSYSLNPEKP